MTKEQVHEIMMSIPSEWRYRWCGGGWCGCMGCSNVSGAVVSKGITEEQWKVRSEEDTSNSSHPAYLVCRPVLEKSFVLMIVCWCL